MDLNTLREQIDTIDEQLVQLFCKRMKIAAEVADYKKERKLPIYVPVREREILQSVVDNGSGKNAQRKTETGTENGGRGALNAVVSKKSAAISDTETANIIARTAASQALRAVRMILATSVILQCFTV